MIRGRLSPELGAVVQRALEAASDQLYQESRQAAPPESIVEEVSSAQRRADALALLAERALANGLDGGIGGRPLPRGFTSSAGRARRLFLSGGARTR